MKLLPIKAEGKGRCYIFIDIILFRLQVFSPGLSSHNMMVKFMVSVFLYEVIIEYLELIVTTLGGRQRLILI